MNEESPKRSLRGIALNRRGLLAAIGVVGTAAAISPAIASADISIKATWSNPTLGTITAHYKAPNYPSHLGTDVANSKGSAIFAACAGTVVGVRTNSYPGDTRPGLLTGRTGNGVLINHAGGYRTYYGHLTSAAVSVGQTVSAGQLIASMGETGNATGPHLHFEVHLNKVTTNPYTFMNGKGINLGKTSPIGGGGWPTVKSGSTGDTVKVFQHLMTARGYSLVADGNFGSVSVTAAKKFQKAKGLVQDGVIGPVSWPFLVYTIQKGSTGAKAKAAQVALNKNGAKLVVDGDFGATSVAAAKVVQKAKGLVQDGVIGPITWPSLI